MKKVITTFVALALIVSVTSCKETTEKKSKKSKKERLEDRAEDDAKTMVSIYVLELAIQEALEDEGTKQIASLEAVALDLQNYIDMLEYYSENEDAFDALAEAMKEEEESIASIVGIIEEIGDEVDYKVWKIYAKSGITILKTELKYLNQELEEMKEDSGIDEDFFDS